MVRSRSFVYYKQINSGAYPCSARSLRKIFSVSVLCIESGTSLGISEQHRLRAEPSTAGDKDQVGIQLGVQRLGTPEKHPRIQKRILNCWGTGLRCAESGVQVIIWFIGRPMSYT
jgi:hypothetical protein